MKQPVQSLSINTERDDRSGLGKAGHSPLDTQSDYNLSPETPDENIDFNLVYALFAFEASVEGQANVLQGESLMLLDDSNSYWWLIRVLRDNSMGYLPAENIETPYERLARLNRHRNQKLYVLDSDKTEPTGGQRKKDPFFRPQNNKNVSFQTPFMPEILGDSEDDYYTEDEDDDSIEEGNNKKNNIFKKIFGGSSKKPKSTSQPSHQLDSLRNNSVATDFSASIYNLNQVQMSSSVDISTTSSQDSHNETLQEAIQVLTVHTGNIDLNFSWKTVVANAQTVILDMIEQSLERFDLEECTSSNYYVVMYDSEEQAVYRLEDYDSPTEVIECVRDGTFQVSEDNQIQDSIYMYLSNKLTSSADLPQTMDESASNKSSSLTFYLNRKLRTIRKDEDITLKFPIQMITIQENGENLNRMHIINAKPSTMVVDFLKLALTEFEIELKESSELSEEYQVSLSTSNIERPLPFDSTLTTVFQVILNYDMEQEREDVLFVIRRNYMPKANPISMIVLDDPSHAPINLESEMIPVIEETYDSDSEETGSYLEDSEDRDGAKLNIHQMSIRLSIVENDKDDISEVLDDVINDYNDEEDEYEETELLKPNQSSVRNPAGHENVNEDNYSQSSESVDSPADTSLDDVTIIQEPTDTQALNVVRPIKPENNSVATLRMANREEKRPSSTEIKTRAIVSSVLRRIAPPPKSPPPPNLIAQRKNSATQISTECAAANTPAQDDTDDQIIANLMINTQLVNAVCNEELAEDVPLADLHGYQIMDKQIYLASSESLVGVLSSATGAELAPESVSEGLLEVEPAMKASVMMEETPLQDINKHPKAGSTINQPAITQDLHAKLSPITVDIVHGKNTRQSSGDSPIAYLEEYLGTMRSQSIRRKNKDDEKVVKLEEILGRTAPSRTLPETAHKAAARTDDDPSAEEALMSTSRNAEYMKTAASATTTTSAEPASLLKELRLTPEIPRPNSILSEADGSIGTDLSGPNSHQTCTLLPLYNIQQTNDSGVALYYNDDEINNLILLVRGAVRFDYDHNETDGSADHRKEFEQGETINQEVRKIFASTEEHLREIEQELDKVMTAIVNVF